ncbi:MAG TPA: hypothetical protein VFW73_08100 [Lacipirellulaceae bacterium]|nr:hypothetical protein [Lacipirellulaceae bacterium]
MNPKLSTDDVLLDRLVDGELTEPERRQLLQSLDERPDGWRRCALSFLEAQSWREELVNFARPEGRKPKAVARVTSDSRWSAAVQWLAIAATVMIAFGLGWLQHGAGLQSVSATTSQNAGLANAGPPFAVPPHSRRGNDALTLYVRDNMGHMNPVHVPLVDAGALDRELGVQFKTGLPAALRNELQNHGYTVQSKRRYAPLWLENGHPMIVPVEDTQILPVGNKSL